MKNAPLLIWGARKKSIGDAVRKMWIDMFDHSQVVTAGISGEEDYLISTSDEVEVRGIYESVKPKFVLCTIGRNETLEEYNGPIEGWLQDMFDANVTTPMSLLSTWLEMEPPAGAQYVVMSSNSAHIPRSQSMAYCCTKAALSMAVRCAARDLQKAEMDVTVYGWEPGLVKGTPMSEGRGGTRMLGLPQGISRRSLAHQIVGAMAFGGPEYSGTLIRLDNGEV